MRHATKYAIPVAAGILFAAGAAQADNGGCSVPEAQWQPRDALQQKLEGEGWTVRSIEVDDGCYEVYGVDADGRRMEAEYNPQTLALLDEEQDADNESQDDNGGEDDDDDGDGD